jgi:hypothetical protein
VTTVTDAGGRTVQAPGFRFAPRPTRGLLLGLHLGQLLLIGMGAAAFVVGLSGGVVGAVLGVLVAAGCVAVAVVPTRSGARVDLLAVAIARHLLRKVAGSSTTTIDVKRHGALQLPPPLHRVELLPVALPDGGEAGVLVDPSAGRYAAILAVSGSSFTLSDADDQGRRVAAWGRALAALSRDRGAVARVQWVARTAPAAGNNLLAHWAADGRQSNNLAAASYEQLIRGAAPTAQDHEVLVAVSLERRGHAVRSRWRDDDSPADALLRDLAHLADQLVAADLHVAGVLPPRGVARLLRTAFDPAAQRSIDARMGEDAGAAATATGPACAETHWDCYRSDSGWHATYWIAEWPRTSVGPDFLAPLLLATDVRHTVALIAEPMSTAAAARKLSAARTAEAANATLRARVGQLTTERQRAEADDVDRRERDLVAGHAVYRYAAFVTVTAATREQLAESCGRIEHAASGAHLELRLLYGQQDLAFLRTLPLALPPS